MTMAAIDGCRDYEQATNIGRTIEEALRNNRRIIDEQVLNNHRPIDAQWHIIPEQATNNLRPIEAYTTDNMRTTGKNLRKAWMVDEESTSNQKTSDQSYMNIWRRIIDQPNTYE